MRGTRTVPGGLTMALLLAGGVAATMAGAAGLANGAGAAELAAAPAVAVGGVASGGAGGRVQNQVLILVNRNRRQAGCGPLTPDRRLNRAAQRHALDMARQRYFAHDSRSGADPGERFSAEGYRWQRYGENIARGARGPAAVVDSWMRSPAHRRTLLDCRLRQMGLGLAYDRRHRPYWVQDLAAPR